MDIETANAELTLLAPLPGWQGDCVLQMRGRLLPVGSAELSKGNGEGLDNRGELRRKN